MCCVEKQLAGKRNLVNVPWGPPGTPVSNEEILLVGDH